MLLVFPYPSVRTDHRGLPVFLTLFTHGSLPDIYESECSFSTIMKTLRSPLSAGRFSFFQCSVFLFFLLGFVLPLWNLSLFLDPFLEFNCSGDRELRIHLSKAAQCACRGSKRCGIRESSLSAQGKGRDRGQKRWLLPQGCRPTGVCLGA